MRQSPRKNHDRPGKQDLALTVKPEPVVASPPIPRVYTVAEAAAVLRLSVRSVRRLIADGKLDVIRIRRSIRIREEKLRAVIEG